MNSGTGSGKRLLLVGGGHAHVEVLRSFAEEPAPDTRLTLVVDRERAVYSGMVPGFVAGQYGADEVEIPLAPLARSAGAELVLEAATRIDAGARQIQVASGRAIPYDVASLDVGSTVAGADLPGVREHAIPTRPIAALVERIEGRIAAVRAHGDAVRVVVVGAGAGGVELAFCLEARLRAEGAATDVLLLDASHTILAEASTSVRHRVEAAARRRRIRTRLGVRVARVRADAVEIEGGARHPSDIVVWVAGAASHAFLRESGLPVDERGFVRIGATLAVEGHGDLFAVGDCASFTPEALPKAGVYAVRAGPVLTRNLRARLRGEEALPYRPQRDFLSLLNLGDGSAVGGKWGVALEGRWVMRLKDWIDRRFMARYGGGSVDAPQPREGANP